jgi:membrane protein YdbS with pleckstrin-like domain
MPEARIKLAAFQVHKFWLIRATLVLVLTCLADGIVVWFAQRPLFWAVLIGSTLPFSMVVFVAIPLFREESRKSAGR